MQYKKTVLIFFCLFFAAGISDAATVLLDKVVAVVNQEVITWSELYRNMEADASPKIKELKEEERAKVFRANESAYLESLINVRLQAQEAKALGISVSSAEVNEAIDGIKKKYGMSDADFRESLVKEGFGYDDYRKKLHEQILIGKVVNQQVRGKAVITEQDVNKFLADNKDFAAGTEGFRVSQIFFKKPKNGDKKAVEEKAASVMKKLKEGESFSDLARLHSEESLAAGGGDLGLIMKDQLMKEFAEVLAGLKPGEVSSPFWTERGLHIIRLDERIAPKDPAAVKEDARKELGNRLFMDRYNRWLKALREKAFIEIRL